MDGVILLIILVPLIILILLINIFNRTGEQRRLLESLYDNIKELSNNLSSLSKQLEKQQEEIPSKPVLHEPPGEVIMPEKTGMAEQIPTLTIIEKEIIPEPELAGMIAEEEPAAPENKKQQPAEMITGPEYRPDKNDDIEKFIGENLANKIGIAVLVLGIAFFIKYAIDKNWVHETGRVITGLISGCILIGLAHYFRNRYRSFSSVLVGGGLSVFYFSIAFAFHQYHLIGQLTAFIAMVLVAALAVLLSLFYNRQELAILAAIGGFITPFLANTGQENHVALFTYLCILNGGLIALSWFKRWPAINIISLFFTTIIFTGWLIKHLFFENALQFPYKDAMLFATLFYLLFVLMNTINSIRLKNKFNAFDFIILLSVNFLYYVAGILVLEYWNNSYSQGLFTFSLGLFNLILAAVFYQKKSIDRNFVSLLTGLSLTFISLTAPVQFRGNHIVLFWAAESVLLFFLYQRSRIHLLRLASNILLAATFISLIITWGEVYFSGEGPAPVIFNKGFITSIVVSACLFLYHYMLKKEQGQENMSSVSNSTARKVVQTASVVILYLAGVLELYHQFSSRFLEVPVYSIFIQAYSYVFAVILLQVYKKHSFFPVMKLLVTGYCFLLYFFSISGNYLVSVSFLSGNENENLFIFHWIADLLLLWLLYDLTRFFYKNENLKWQEYRTGFTWVCAAAILLVLSNELNQVNMWANYRNENDWAWWNKLYRKAGLSILWSICSFFMMWLGMKHSFRTLRIISLTLFTITLVKLFVFDIRDMPPGGKIAAFILLGILLLVVSFMYQRLKKIIVEDSAA